MNAIDTICDNKKLTPQQLDELLTEERPELRSVCEHTGRITHAFRDGSRIVIEGDSFWAEFASGRDSRHEGAA
jgi:hypothetical protein